jgi:hypothetical protein
VFTSQCNAGFQMTFANGVTVSIQFKTGNYATGALAGWDSRAGLAQEQNSSPDAEIAIFKANGGGWLTKKFDPTINDDVIGWVSPDRVAEAIAWAAKYNVPG